MTNCKHFEGCQEYPEGVCEKCRQTFCNKHLVKGSFTGPGSTRQVYGNYCFSCRKVLEETQAFKPGSSWNSGAAYQMYILFAFIISILILAYTFFKF